MLYESVKRTLGRGFFVFIAVFAAALLIFSNNAVAASGNFEVVDVAVAEKSDSIEGGITNVATTTIEQNMTFHAVGDSVRYDVTVRNTGEEGLEIEDISVENDNDYMAYEVGDYGGTIVAAGDTFIFSVRIVYATQLSDIDQREQDSDAKILIKYVNQEEPEVIDIVTPDTSDEIWLFGIIMLVSIAGLVIVAFCTSKNKKTMRLLAIVVLAAAIITPVAVWAADNCDEITLTSIYSLKDRLVVNVTLGDETSEQIVNYGDTVAQLEQPTKAGYSFSKWTINGADCDEDTVIVDDMEITAVLTPNTNTPYRVVYKLMNLDGETYETAKTMYGNGTTDTPVTPTVDEYEGFISPAEQTVPIAGDGSTVIEYLYERDKRTLTLMDAEYIDGEFTSGEYYYGTRVTLKAKIREGYAFVKWSTGATDEEISFDLLTNTKIGPVYEEDGSLHSVFELDGPCEFHGANGVITGCEEYAGQRYIDTGVALFNEDYYDKDFYISFDIDSINTSNLDYRATLISATLEEKSRQFPGIVFRRDNNTSNFLFGSNVVKNRVKLSDKKIYFPISDVQSFAVIRKNMNVCYSVNGGDPVFVNNYDDFNEFNDLTTTIGAAIENDVPIRFFTGTLSNVVIKLGADVHDSMTCEED